MEERRQQSSGGFRSNDLSDGLDKGRDRERERERDVARVRERERDQDRDATRSSSTSASDRGGREKELQLIRDQYLGKRVKVFFFFLNLSENMHISILSKSAKTK